MSDIISRSALLKKQICMWDEFLGTRECVLTEDIEDAPSVDAVEVVRCKDCKHAMPWSNPKDGAIGDCKIRVWSSKDKYFYMVGAGDFCSYGERK